MSYDCCLCLKQDTIVPATIKFRLRLNTDNSWDSFSYFGSSHVYLCKHCYTSNRLPEYVEDLETSETGFNIRVEGSRRCQVM